MINHSFITSTNNKTATHAYHNEHNETYLQYYLTK